MAALIVRVLVPHIDRGVARWEYRVEVYIDAGVHVRFAAIGAEARNLVCEVRTA